MKLREFGSSTVVAAALLAAWFAAGCAATSGDSRDSHPLIPRSVIFGNPERANAQISPDGRRIAFLAPRQGVLNIWVVDRGKPLSEARALTADRERPIRQYFWSADGEQVLYVQDKGGDENFLLYDVEVSSGKERKLTPFSGVQVQVVGDSLSHPDEIVVAINDRDKAYHDPYRVNLRTGELRRLFENTEKFASFISDEDLEIRFATRATPDGGFEFLRVAGGKGTVLERVGFEDSQTAGPASLTRDGRTLYWRESRGRNTSAVYAIDVGSRERSLIFEDARVDVNWLWTDPATGRVLAVARNYLRSEWRAVDPSVQADVAFLDSHLPGQWNVASASRSNRLWVVNHDPVTAPQRVVLYDRDAKKIEELFVTRPALAGEALPRVCPLEIKARDGQTLTAYLTLPVGDDTGGPDCRPRRPLPLVLNVHGGPWGRDHFGYTGESVWFADRGYASLRVNFRSSTGFGKQFVNLGDREWGRKMHDDLLDGVQWAIANRVADPENVAVYGGSYGGYATLWAATHSPETFACAVAIVAPSNLKTLLASIPPYWESFREQLYRRVGDPRTPDGSALLDERSPLTYVQNIRRPLLIGQGANDPRVKKAEADQIVGAMEANSIPVTYVLYPDEGHGFARAENRTSFYAVSEAFLSRCLGGRFEPIGNDFQGASLQVPKGADYVPGLEEALTKASTKAH
jgi:dipeptidyl aminopeptidase/acylaminoacyl peptidase